MPASGRAAALVAVLLCAAPPLAAQAAELHLTPRIGVFAPVDRLVDERGALIHFRADLAPGLVVGLGLELAAPRLRLGVRAGVDYVTASTIVARGITVDSADVGVLAASGDLVFRPWAPSGRVRPFLAAGAAMKRYLVPEASLTRALAGVLPRDRTDPALHAAAGADVRWGSLGLVFEVGDYVSWFDAPATTGRRMQNDLVVTGGVRVKVF